MESNIENHVLSLPVIQRLPVELLAEIFLLCISTRSPPMIHVSTEPPTSLCRVCRTWREVALNLPRLWTALSVDMDALAVGAEENKSLPDLVHQWVARASHLPLTFRFKLTRFGADESTAFNAFVAPFAHRLRHLDMISWIDPKLWSRSQLQFPVLEAVILRHRLADADVNFAPFIPLAQLLLPWNQLTHLFTDYVFGFAEFQRTFRECHRLQQGIFALFCLRPPSAESHDSKQYVVLHHLVELTVCFVLWIDFAILSPFELPALRTLRVETDKLNSGGWPEVVHDRFFQQLLHIQKLRLGCTRGLPLSVLILLLKATPHAFELDFQVDDDCRDIFYFLQNYPMPGKDLVLPNLKILLVELTPPCWMQSDSLEIKIISNLVRSRIRTREEGSRFEKLALYLGGGPTARGVVDQLTAELQPWVDDGLHLEVTAGASNHWSERIDHAATHYLHGGLVGLDRQSNERYESPK